MGALVGEADIDTFREDGVVCLRGAFEPHWLTLLATGIEQARAAPGPYAKEYAPPGRGSYFTDHHVFLRFEPFRRFLFESPAAAIAAEIMGASRLNLYDEHLLVKEPNTETPTWWHHDLPYFSIEGDQICSIWLSLDPATEETGAMRFALGSHRWGTLFRPVRIGAGDPVPGSEADLPPVPDVDAHPDRYLTAGFDLEPGDCVVFHGRTLHSARGNASATTRRRALSLRFAGDDIRWKNRSAAPLVFPSALNDGDPIDRAECPRVWPRG